jgi:type IV pilus assembly protein PilE
MPLERAQSGFTLIELMVALAVAAVISAIALPSYTAYIQRSKVPVALDALSAYATRMEQRYQDSGSYANGAACAAAWPTPAPANFDTSCALANGGQGFTATATGSGPMAGYTYTIDHNGVRRTTAHPKGVPGTNCWTTRGGTCDT